MLYVLKRDAKVGYRNAQVGESQPGWAYPGTRDRVRHLAIVVLILRSYGPSVFGHAAQFVQALGGETSHDGYSGCVCTV